MLFYIITGLVLFSFTNTYNAIMGDFTTISIEFKRDLFRNLYFALDGDRKGEVLQFIYIMIASWFILIYTLLIIFHLVFGNTHYMPFEYVLLMYFWVSPFLKLDLENLVERFEAFLNDLYK